MPFSPHAFRNVSIAAVVAVLFVFALAGFGLSQYNLVSVDLEQKSRQLADAASRIEILQEDLRAAQEALRAEEAKMAVFQQQIEGITGAVDILQRLEGTDRELLQKYSRTYFLSENYIPSEIAPIEDQYLYNKNEPQWVHTLVKPFLEQMIKAAGSAGVDLKVVSAYRSFREQSLVSDSYYTIFGRGANQFSAEQGYSEHQLGTTIDFTSPEIDVVFENFENTESYAWLGANAYSYGFVLSYPEDNPYYIFEPWHWRFVGVKLATFLHDQKRHFYDLDQEEINQYLLGVFE